MNYSQGFYPLSTPNTRQQVHPNMSMNLGMYAHPHPPSPQMLYSPTPFMFPSHHLFTHPHPHPPPSPYYAPHPAATSNSMMMMMPPPQTPLNVNPKTKIKKKHGQDEEDEEEEEEGGEEEEEEEEDNQDIEELENRERRWAQFVQKVIRQFKEFSRVNKNPQKAPCISIAHVLKICLYITKDDKISNECLFHLCEHLMTRLKEEKVKCQQIVKMQGLDHNCDVFYRRNKKKTTEDVFEEEEEDAENDSSSQESDENQKLFSTFNSVFVTPSGLYCILRYWFYYTFQNPNHFDSEQQISCLREIFKSISSLISQVFPASQYVRFWPLQLCYPQLFTQELSGMPILTSDKSNFLKDLEKQIYIPASFSKSVQFLPVDVILGRISSFFQKSNISHLSLAKQNEILAHLLSLHLEQIQNSLFYSSHLIELEHFRNTHKTSSESENKEKRKLPLAPPPQATTNIQIQTEKEKIQKLQSEVFKALVTRLYPGPIDHVQMERKTKCLTAAQKILAELTTKEVFSKTYEQKDIEFIQSDLKHRISTYENSEHLSKLVNGFMSAFDFLQILLLTNAKMNE